MKKITLSLIFILATVPAFSQSAAYTEKKKGKLAAKSPFEKIWDGKLPAEVVYKDDEIIAFVPLRRQSPVHYLVVPKKRITTINEMTDEDALVVGRMFIVARDLAKKYGIAETGYRLSVNTNEDAGQSVFHLHLHLLGGMKTGPMVDQTYTDPNPRKEKD